MKKAYLLFALAVFIFAGCKKDQEPDLESVFKVTKDGKSWNSSSDGAILYQDNFVITASRPIGKGYDESIMINFKKSDISDLGKVNKFEARFSYILGGDGIVASYENLVGSQNSLKITQIDMTKKTIEGEFAFTLEQRSKYKASSDDRILLEEGKFKLSYKE